MDKGGVTALTLLELSATLDIIGHATLTGRLSDWLRISGKAHICFLLFVVKLKTLCQIKSRCHVEFHRALFWDQCFLPYALHHSTISSFDINHHLYADNTQMPMIFKCTCTLFNRCVGPG